MSLEPLALLSLVLPSFIVGLFLYGGTDYMPLVPMISKEVKPLGLSFNSYIKPEK